MLYIRIFGLFLIFLYMCICLRKSPIVVCALPLILTMGEGVFIRTWGVSFSPPGFPIQLQWIDIVFGALVLAWVFLWQKRPVHKPIKFGWDLLVVWILLILIILQIPLSWIVDSAFHPGVVLAVRDFLYFPLAMLLWLDILRRSTRQEVEDLLCALCILMVPLAILYVLAVSGLFDIYPASSYYTGTYESATVIRNAIAFPLYMQLALAYFLTRSRHKIGDWLAIGVLFTSILFTYTRSWIIPAAVMVVILVVYTSVVQGAIVKTLRWLLLLAGMILAVWYFMNTFFPSNLAYVGKRFQEIQLDALLKSGSLQSRSDTINNINMKIQKIDPFFGAGFSQATSSEVVSIEQNHIIGDSLWATILLPLGWSGVFGFALLLLTLLLISLKLLWRVKGRHRWQIYIVLFMVMVWSVMRTFTSNEIVIFQFAGYTFLFTLVMAANRAVWSENPVTEPGLPLLEGVLSGVNLNWFSAEDKYWWARRLVLAVLLGIISIYVGLKIAK